MSIMNNLTFKNIDEFKLYLNKNKTADFLLDISSMNIFDSLQFAVLSSEYFYRKHPLEKLKCKLPSDDVKTLISSFKVQNLEFV